MLQTRKIRMRNELTTKLRWKSSNVHLEEKFEIYKGLCVEIIANIIMCMSFFNFLLFAFVGSCSWYPTPTSCFDFPETYRQNLLHSVSCILKRFCK